MGTYYLLDEEHENYQKGNRLPFPKWEVSRSQNANLLTPIDIKQRIRYRNESDRLIACRVTYSTIELITHLITNCDRTT